MTKTELTSAIGTAMSIVISRVKLLLGISKIVDEIYPTPIYDTQATTNVFTKEADNFTYIIRGTKIGRNVSISGRFTNTTGVSIGSQTLCDITNSEYNNYVFATDQTFIAQSTTGQTVLVSVSGNSLYIIGTIPNNVAFYFNFTYQVAN